MKLRNLEQSLQENMEAFTCPKVHLEQYPSTSVIASRLVWIAETQYGDINGRSVLDLGCGAGMLSAAALLLEPELVVGVEIDTDAIADCVSNISGMFEHPPPFDIINTDVLCLPKLLRNSTFQTIILNPPFGTKCNAGIDAKFLEVAFAMGTPNASIYSMHKSSTSSYILSKSLRGEWKERVKEVKVVDHFKFPLENQFKFHKKSLKTVDVSLFRFQLR